jgi:hypothetical protein
MCKILMIFMLEEHMLVIMVQNFRTSDVNWYQELSIGGSYKSLDILNCTPETNLGDLTDIGGAGAQKVVLCSCVLSLCARARPPGKIQRHK